MTEEQWLNKFGKNLEKIMKESQMNQKKLAEAAQLSYSAINNYIHGVQTPNIRAAINLSYALDCSLDELLEFGSMLD